MNEGKVTGLVSRFRDDDPDKAEFVDQYFQDQAKLDGATLSFRTKPADGVWFESPEWSSAARPGLRLTRLLERAGTLTEQRTSTARKSVRKVQSLTLKSFPQDTEPNPAAAGETID